MGKRRTQKETFPLEATILTSTYIRASLGGGSGTTVAAANRTNITDQSADLRNLNKEEDVTNLNQLGPLSPSI